MTLLLVLQLLATSYAADPAPTAALAGQLTVDRILGSPSLNGDLPDKMKFSPDGKRLAFVQGKKENLKILDLWEYDFATKTKKKLVDASEFIKGGEKLSNEEKALRERLRQANTGIVDFHWSEQSDRILVPINGDLYLYQLKSTPKIRRLTQSKEFEFDPQFSPKGNYVSFVRDHNLFIIDLRTQKETQLTRGGTEKSPYGVAEFIAQEELRRYRGYWWAPDESQIAFEKFDASPVEMTKRLDMQASGIEVIEEPFPRAGTANVKYQLGLVNIQNKNLAWVPIDKGDTYLADVKWAPYDDELILSYQILPRDQKSLTLWFYKPQTRANQKILVDKDIAFIEARHDITFLKKQKSFMFVSDRSGYPHLYLYDLLGNLKTQLTKGEGGVEVLHGPDADETKVYYNSRAKSILESHLYSVAMSGTEVPIGLTTEEGLHSITLNAGAPVYVDRLVSVNQPPQVVLRGYDGTSSVLAGDVTKNHPMAPYMDNLSTKEFRILKSAGVAIHYVLWKPKSFDESKKYPVIQFVYGGPHKQMVEKGWLGDWNLFAEVLAQKGYLVVIGDNRGTPNRGRDFERAIYRKMGDVEVRDQSEILKAVLREPYADASRVGVFGHSYGGFASLMLYFKHSNLYKAAAASAPVTDFSLYDTCYTERYLDKPQDQPQVYKEANVRTFTKPTSGRLLVLHGTADDNVLFTHSTLLFDDLQKKGILFDSVVYPGSKHNYFVKETKAHVYKSILNHFDRNL